jgi:hypothetical protein
LLLFLLVSAIDGPAIIGGSMLGAAVSRLGLFVGAVVGGLLGIVVAARAAVRLGLIPSHVWRATAAGGIIGFAIASAVLGAPGDLVPFQDLALPVGPALCGAFVPLGAVIGSRDHRRR